MREIERKLEGVKTVTYSRHFVEERLPDREHVDRGLIEEHLGNPGTLVGAELQEDDYPGEKYELLFDHSRGHLLRVIASFKNEHLNVVTAHVVGKG